MTRATNTSPKTLTRDVKETLLGWIRDGMYPPGSQLPSVPELVEKLSVSRTVVREALQALVGMNFVEMRAGVGCFVNWVPADLIVNPEVMAALLDLGTLIEVANARKVIEGAVARLAAVTATQDDFEEMESVLFRIERLAQRNRPVCAETPLLHIAVARSTHNRVLANTIASFNSLMAAAGDLIERRNHSEERRMREYHSHRHLVDMLRMRDPNRAQSEMELHIQETIEELEAIRTTREAVGENALESVSAVKE